MATSGFMAALDTAQKFLGKREDPYAAFNFAVYIKERPSIKDIVKKSALTAIDLVKKDVAGAVGAAQDLLMARCSECSGLQSSLDTYPYREGGVNGREHILYGAVRWPPLVLRRGVTDDLWWDWYEEAMASGRKARKSGIVFLKDAEGHYIMSWHFKDALPVKWSGPEFRAGSAAVAFETIELVHKGLTFQEHGSFTKD